MARAFQNYMTEKEADDVSKAHRFLEERFGTIALGFLQSMFSVFQDSQTALYKDNLTWLAQQATADPANYQTICAQLMEACRTTMDGAAETLVKGDIRAVVEWLHSNPMIAPLGLPARLDRLRAVPQPDGSAKDMTADVAHTVLTIYTIARLRHADPNISGFMFAETLRLKAAKAAVDSLNYVELGTRVTEGLAQRVFAARMSQLRASSEVQVTAETEEQLQAVARKDTDTVVAEASNEIASILIDNPVANEFFGLCSLALSGHT